MDLKEAVAVARKQIEETFAADAPQEMRLEGFLYDDHLMVWSLTIGFSLLDHTQEKSAFAPRERIYKIVRVSEADKSILSVQDR